MAVVWIKLSPTGIVHQAKRRLGWVLRLDPLQRSVDALLDLVTWYADEQTKK